MALPYRMSERIGRVMLNARNVEDTGKEYSRVRWIRYLRGFLSGLEYLLPDDAGVWASLDKHVDLTLLILRGEFDTIRR